jgi:hypothetical protein
VNHDSILLRRSGLKRGKSVLQWRNRAFETTAELKRSDDRDRSNHSRSIWKGWLRVTISRITKNNNQTVRRSDWFLQKSSIEMPGEGIKIEQLDWILNEIRSTVQNLAIATMKHSTR